MAVEDWCEWASAPQLGRQMVRDSERPAAARRVAYVDTGGLVASATGCHEQKCNCKRDTVARTQHLRGVC